MPDTKLTFAHGTAAIHHGRIKHLRYMFRPTHSQYCALDVLW
jgi:hypothetical protein